MAVRFSPESTKDQVRSYWEEEPCGTRYGSSISRKEYFDQIEATRYRLDSYMPGFINFARADGKKVLEIGVGAGTDFQNWVKQGAAATGIDLTQSGIDLTRERLSLSGVPEVRYHLRVADAEHLPFADNEFDIVYSWGVLHHTPDTEGAFREVHRVLRPGGTFIGMIYHVPSWTGWMVWTGHCLLRGRPFRSVKYAIDHHLESPGTKAYTVPEAREMLARTGLEIVQLVPKLCSGDLLLIAPARKYRHPVFKLVWKLYPRWFVRMLGDRYGFFILVEARKLPVR